MCHGTMVVSHQNETHTRELNENEQIAQARIKSHGFASTQITSEALGTYSFHMDVPILYKLWLTALRCVVLHFVANTVQCSLC